VVRFTMLTRKPEAQMDFDFDKVVGASKDNPVFYAICPCAHPLHAAQGRGGGFAPSGDALDLLGEEELALVKLAAQFPRLVEAAAQARTAPRGLFLHDLAAAFHAYWNLATIGPTSASSCPKTRH
jgi:arginyl-tRNA synthetase